MLLTLRGTPFLYYGEEIGLGDIRVARREIVDPPARHYWPLPLWWNRDGCRAPMPWTDARNGGFTTGRPWLPLAPDAAARNVDRQAADPTSVLATYRRLLALRRALPALQAGSFRWVVRARDDVLAYRRDLADEAVLVAINLGRHEARVELEGTDARLAWQRRFSTADGDGTPAASEAAPRAGPAIELRPLEAVILRATVSG